MYQFKIRRKNDKKDDLYFSMKFFYDFLGFLCFESFVLFLC